MSTGRLITAEEEYEKDSNLKKEDVVKLRHWLQTQPDLPHYLTDEKLLLYIHCSDYDLEKAKKVIKRDWALRSIYPEMFSNLDPCSIEQQNIWRLIEFWISEEMTPEGYRIAYAGLHNFDASKYNFLEAIKGAVMVLRSDSAERGTCPGYIFVLNAKGTSFRHVMKASLTYIKAFLTYAQEGNPIKMKAVHIINISSVVDKLMVLTKPFINKGLNNIIHLHSGDMRAFFEVLKRNVLPNELGGTAGTSKELRNASKLKIESYQQFFKEENDILVLQRQSSMSSSPSTSLDIKLT